jgi:hypothetical protein
MSSVARFFLEPLTLQSLETAQYARWQKSG